MNINYKETQFELFPNASAAQELERPRALSAQLTVSGENLVILAIAGIMCLLLSFSIGVERGKRVSLPQRAEPKTVLSEPSVVNVVQSPLQAESVSQEATRKISVPLPDVSTQALKKDQESPRKADKDVPAGSFTVQVASYKTEKVADREAESLKKKGYRDVYVVPKGAYVIVCVGNFSSKSDAKAYTSKLKNRYADTVVRRL